MIGMHLTSELMGTQIACVTIISKFLEASLKNNLSTFPEDFPKTELTLFGQHLYSVMISILFSRKSIPDQLQMLNSIYLYKLSEENINLFLQKSKEYYDYIKSDLKSLSDKNTNRDNFFDTVMENDPGQINWDSSDDIDKELFSIQHDLFFKHLFSPAIDICQIALQKNKNSKTEIIIYFKDALATIYRELGEYSRALEQFREVRIYWESKKNEYQIFLGLKNESYCYGKLGELTYSDHLFKQIEEILDKFPETQLGPIYQNLGTRYHFLKNFQKEYHYFQLSMKYLPQNSQRYNEIKKAINLIEKCKKPNSNVIDFVKLNIIYRKIHFKEFIEKFQENRDKLIPNIAEGFLNLAYDWADEKDLDYYLELIDLAIMKSDFKQINSLICKLDREYYSLAYLYGLGIMQLQTNNILEFWEILHQLDFIAYTNIAECKNLLTKEIEWCDIINPITRNEIITSLEDKIILKVNKDGFSDYEKMPDKSQDSHMTMMANQ